MKITPFGLKLRALREEKRLGLRELASMAEISPAFLSKIESGKEKPPAEGKLRALAKVLDCDPDVLMALAGRLPDDVVKVIQRHPKQYVALLRALRNLSVEQLEQVRGLSVQMWKMEIPPMPPEKMRELVKSFKKGTLQHRRTIQVTEPAKVKFAKDSLRERQESERR